MNIYNVWDWDVNKCIDPLTNARSVLNWMAATGIRAGLQIYSDFD